MSDFEDALRRRLRDTSMRITDEGSVHRVVHRVEGAGRRSRSVLAIALTVAAVGCVLVAVPLVRHSGSHSKAVGATSSNAVPWIAKKATAAIEQNDTAANLHACRRGDLRLTVTRPKLAGQTVFYPIRVRNLSSTACTVSASFDSLAPRSDPSAKYRISTSASDAGSVVLRADGVATSQVAINSCAAPSARQRKVVHPTFRLNGVGALSSSSGSLNVNCSQLSASPLTASQDPPATTPLDSLTATIQVPASITPGQTLDYSVTLTNPSSAAVPLSSCPNYVEVVGPPGYSETYQLNCTTASISPGQSVTFDMQLGIPATLDATANPAKLIWYIPNGPSVGTTIQVG
jgi:hypothetical protein